MTKSTIGPLDITFTATMGRVHAGDTWTCVQMPDSAIVFGAATRSRQSRRHRRRRGVPQLVHGARRRYPQASHHRCHPQGHRQDRRRRCRRSPEATPQLMPLSRLGAVASARGCTARERSTSAATAPIASVQPSSFTTGYRRSWTNDRLSGALLEMSINWLRRMDQRNPRAIEGAGARVRSGKEEASQRPSADASRTVIMAGSASS